MNATNNELVYASFYANALMKAEFGEIERAMSMVPGAKLLSLGTSMKYRINSIDRHEDTLELCRDKVIYTYKVQRASRIESNMNLLRFLSLLGLLKEVYEVEFGSIYGFVVAALRDCTAVPEQNMQIDYDAISARVDALSKVNASVSKEMILLHKEVQRLRNENAIFIRFCSEVFDKFSEGPRTKGRTIPPRYSSLVSTRTL